MSLELPDYAQRVARWGRRFAITRDKGRECCNGLNSISRNYTCQVDV